MSGCQRSCAPEHRSTLSASHVLYFCFYSLNNVYVEGSSISFVLDRHLLYQIQNWWPETVDPQTLDPQRVDPQRFELYPKSVSRDSRPPETRSPQSRPQSGSPELRVCISIMQEPMLGHLTVLRSPVPSASGSPERRGSTDPDPKSVTRESGSPELRVCISAW